MNEEVIFLLSLLKVKLYSEFGLTQTDSKFRISLNGLEEFNPNLQRWRTVPKTSVPSVLTGRRKRCVPKTITRNY